jgi:putative hemolysin
VTTGILIILAVLPLLLAACTLNSAAETALFGLTYHDRTRLKRVSPRALAAAERLLARPRELLVSILFVNMIVSTLYFVLTSILLIEATSRDMQWLGVAVSLINLLLMTVVAEVVSKMLAARRRVEFTRVLVGPTAIMVAALGPLRSFLDAAVIAPLARVISPGGVAAGLAGRLSEGELSTLLEIGAREGTIDTGEQRVLKQVIKLGGMRVRELMTPRVDMVWLEESSTVEDVRSVAVRHGLTRVPVCRGSLDDEVLGMLDVKGYLAAAARLGAGGGASAGGPAGPSLRGFLGPVRFVPDRATLDKLLERMRQTHAKIALCVDEYGAITGAVSTRDVVEHLVREIRSEDARAEDGEVQMVGLGEWLVPGRLPAREWAEMFGLKPDARVSTVAGLVLARLGRLPVVGDEVRLGNVRLTVEAVEGRVAERVRVRLVMEGDEQGPATSVGRQP